MKNEFNSAYKNVMDKMKAKKMIERLEARVESMFMEEYFHQSPKTANTFNKTAIDMKKKKPINLVVEMVCSPPVDKFKTAQQFWDKKNLLENDNENESNDPELNLEDSTVNLAGEDPLAHHGHMHLSMGHHLEHLKHFEEHAPTFVMIKRRKPFLELTTKQATID